MDIMYNIQIFIFCEVITLYLTEVTVSVAALLNKIN